MSVDFDWGRMITVIPFFRPFDYIKITRVVSVLKVGCSRSTSSLTNILTSGLLRFTSRQFHSILTVGSIPVQWDLMVDSCYCLTKCVSVSFVCVMPLWMLYIVYALFDFFCYDHWPLAFVTLLADSWPYAFVTPDLNMLLWPHAFVSVDMRTGRPCVDYLDNLDLWQPKFSLSTMLVTLQVEKRSQWFRQQFINGENNCLSHITQFSHVT